MHDGLEVCVLGAVEHEAALHRIEPVHLVGECVVGGEGACRRKRDRRGGCAAVERRLDRGHGRHRDACAAALGEELLHAAFVRAVVEIRALEVEALKVVRGRERSPVGVSAGEVVVGRFVEGESRADGGERNLDRRSGLDVNAGSLGGEVRRAKRLDDVECRLDVSKERLDGERKGR